MEKKRLSIMVPALNEEENLEKTIAEIKKANKKNLSNYEIIIFNDGSTDNTKEIAQTLAKKDKKIRLINNQKNRGIGYCYRKGAPIAKYEYYMYVPGDNQFPAKALSLLIDEIGKADIVIPYVTNMNIRPLGRQLISYLFTNLMNFLFNLEINYYNAPVIHKTKLLLGVPQNPNSGHFYQAEILVRLIRAGASFTQVGFDMHERVEGKTTALKSKNIKRVVWALVPLFWQLQILKKPPVSTKVIKLMSDHTH